MVHPRIEHVLDQHPALLVPGLGACDVPHVGATRRKREVAHHLGLERPRVPAIGRRKRRVAGFAVLDAHHLHDRIERGGRGEGLHGLRMENVLRVGQHARARRPASPPAP